MKRNNPKNISEYVANEVIREMKYKDDEMKKMKEENIRLKEDLYFICDRFDIIKCHECMRYSKHWDSCQVCGLTCCEECNETKFNIEHIRTWNLSGMRMCKTCSSTHCNNCTTKITMPPICPICHEGFCPRCVDELFKIKCKCKC